MKFLAMVVVGFASGMFSGLFGVGGGVIIVPALILIGRVDMKLAVGTSLAAIVPTAFMGALTHFKAGHVDLKMALFLACGAVFGTVIGSHLVTVIPSGSLKRAYALFLLAVAMKLLIEKT